MKILVCIKEVPDTAETPRITADGVDVERDGMAHVMSPFDENALEAALTIRDGRGEGEVVVLSLGRPEAERMLRSQALAMGADRAVLLDGPGMAALDGWAAARIVADWCRRENPELVLCGKFAVDDGLGVFGPALAQELGRPYVGEVFHLEDLAGEGELRLRRGHSDGTTTLRCALPAVISAEKALNVPRFPTLKGKMRAKKAEIERPTDAENRDVAERRLDVTALRRPPEGRKTCQLCEGPVEEAAATLAKLLRDEAKAI